MNRLCSVFRPLLDTPHAVLVTFGLAPGKRVSASGRRGEALRHCLVSASSLHVDWGFAICACVMGCPQLRPRSGFRRFAFHPLNQSLNRPPPSLALARTGKVCQSEWFCDVERQTSSASQAFLCAFMVSTSPSSQRTMRSPMSPPPNRLARFWGLVESITCTVKCAPNSPNHVGEGRSRMAPMLTRMRVCSLSVSKGRRGEVRVVIAYLVISCELVFHRFQLCDT